MIRLTIEEIQNGFASRGWKLLSKEYHGSQKKLDVICNKGHETTITWNNFQREQGCKVCAGNQKFDFPFVYNFFEQNRCKLLSKEYLNSQEMLDYICICGTQAKINFAEFRRGRRCLNCKGHKISISLMKELPVEKMKELCCISGTQFIRGYRDSKKIKIDFVCKCGQIYSAYWSNFQKTQNCKKCGSMKIAKDKSYRWISDRSTIETNKLMQKRCYNLVQRSLKRFEQTKTSVKSVILGYTVSELKNSIINHPLYNSNIEYELDHVFPVHLFVESGINDMKLVNHLNNLRPLHKSINVSKSSKTVKDAFPLWLRDTSQPAENIINQYLINDINTFMPDAVLLQPQDNYNFYRHLYLKDKIEDKNKLYIHAYEWVNHKNEIIARYNSLNKGKFNKIPARNCDARVLDHLTWRTFCDLNHIQGANRLSKIAIGLFYKNTLVGGISLGRHHRGGLELVLDRMCFAAGIHVSGGTEKLFCHALKWAKLNQHTKIISFSDNRYTDGKVYERLGFIKEKDLPPDYSYVLKTDISLGFSKQSQQNSITGCPEGKTESEWAAKRGLTKIYDCGKKRWIYELN